MEEPSIIGRYEIRGIIGRGGMGVVYLAWDPVIGREVAVKRLVLKDFTEAQAQEIRERFRREAVAAGRLNHPYITTVFDVGEQGGEAFIAMEYVKGSSLDKLMAKESPLPLDKIARLIGDIASALDHAHDQGIIHRDIKPCNILIPECAGVKITDFGIARIEDLRMTRTGAMLGSPSYMSPEQILGKDIDRRSDVFGLGVILYMMLTGQKPFAGDSLATLSFKIVQEHPTPPSHLAPGIDPALDTIVARALAKNPDQRYQRAGELAAAVQSVARRLAERDKDKTYVPPEDKQTETFPTMTVIPLEEGRTVRGALARIVSGNTPYWIGGGILALAAVIAAIYMLILMRPLTISWNGAPKPKTGGKVAVAAPSDEYKPVGIVPRAYILWRDARKAVDEGNNKQARLLLNELTLLEPDDAQAHLALGKVLQTDGLTEESLKSYRRALQLNPVLRSDEKLIAELVSLLGASKGAEAAGILAEVIGEPAEKALLEAAAASQPGRRTEESRRGREALEVLIRIWRLRLEKKPDDVDTRLNVARALYRLEKYGEALKEYALVIEKRPGVAKDAEIIFNVVELLDNSRYDQDAAAVLVAIGPRAIESLRSVGQDRSSRMRKLAHETIRKILEKQVETEKDNAQAALDLAFICDEDGDRQGTIDAVSMAIERNPALAGDRKVVDLLIKLLDGENAGPVEKLLVEKSGDRAVESLLTAVGSDNYNRRWNAAAVLDELGKSDSFERMDLWVMDLLDDETSCSTKKDVAAAMMEADKSRASKIITDSLDERAVRKCGKKVFEKIVEGAVD